MNDTHHIDASSCTKCELCIKVCPAGIITIIDESEIGFRDDRTSICIHCGHCMAMCESKSILIEGLAYETNFRDIPQITMDHQHLMDFLLTRRSVRIFKDKQVTEELLRKIIDTLSTAPFGVSPDNVEITVVSNKSLIEKAAPYMSKMYLQFGKVLRIPVLGWMIRRSIPQESRNTLMNFILPHIDKGLYSYTNGIDDIARNAPAMILFHAPAGAEEHTVDAHIYLTYALLAAHSLGLGATAIGLIGPAINQSKALRKMFKIPTGNEVVESMILGYPKLQFKRAIIRPRKNIRYLS